MATAPHNPQHLHDALSAKENADLSLQCRAEAQSRLATVVLDRVRQSFLCTSIVHPRSDLRPGRLRQLNEDLSWANCFASTMGDQARELGRFHEDTKALAAAARAQELRQEATRCTQEVQRIEMEEKAPWADAEALAVRHRKCEEDRKRIVAETLDLLRSWTRHSQMCKELLGALICMADVGGDEFRLEMDRRGLGMLASTVADVWASRPEVARLGLRLLGMVSIGLLTSQIAESMREGTLVCLGLAALNQLTRTDSSVIDVLAENGGRELLDEVDQNWSSEHMIALHSLNLRRKLRKSHVKSLKPKKTVELPADDVMRIRGCFDAIDEDESGCIDADELAVAFQLMGIKASRTEIEEALLEVDLDGSGKVEWPEFLYLMSRYGASGTIESQFTEERLAELREVFTLFDADGNGSLDVRELGMVMRSVGLCPTDMEIRAMINEVDADQSGCIEFPEFLYLMSKKVPDPENQHRLAFQFFDQANDGYIKRDNFIRQMRDLSSEFSVEDLDEMIFQAKFENGELDMLTYREFVKMMMRS